MGGARPIGEGGEDDPNLVAGRWPAPDLTAPRRDPAITETALRNHLQTSHARMPNIMPSQEQADDLVAYLLNLRGDTP